MDFEHNKKAILKQLSGIRRDKIIKQKENSLKQKKLAMEAGQKKISHSISKKKIKVMIFGEKSLFLNTLKQMLQARADVVSGEDPEWAINYCIDNGLKTIVLDMDEPTDWKKSTDVFTNTKTLDPQTTFILCTKDPHATPVQILEAQGGFVLTKPVSIDTLYDLLDVKNDGDD